MNSGITLSDVRYEAMDVIRKLKNGEIEVKEAQTIKGLLDTVIDTAKTQVEFIKAIPNSVKEQLSVKEVKAIAGTLQTRDAELDLSMMEIEERRKKIYQEL
jgi:hypothetical protein